MITDTGLRSRAEPDSASYWRAHPVGVPEMLTNRPAIVTLIVGAALLSALLNRPVSATWSIVLVNTETKEIAVGSATCLTGFDLKFYLPVVVVGKGGGVSQAQVDAPAPIERRIIWDGLHAGTDPEDILDAMAAAEPFNHQRRQYGIVDHLGRRLTFTGSETFAFADGVVGTTGPISYAIQGNILTGSPVITEAELAVLNTPGALPERLMAAMEAAYSMGGDGRCSCDPDAPTSCGAPPEEFEKTAHVGFMIVSRIGDTDGICNFMNGCANGNYYMTLNVANQTASDPDPVLQLRALFDAFHDDLIGRPDALETHVKLIPPALPANGAVSSLNIALADWQGAPVISGSASVSVSHGPGSPGVITIGSVTNHGDGTYSIPLTAGMATGTDSFKIVVDDGIRPVTLMPPPALTVVTPGDMNGDGLVDGADIQGYVDVVTGEETNPLRQAATDLNGNSVYGDDTDDFVSLLLGM
jgi:hypothetical protein